MLGWVEELPFFHPSSPLTNEMKANAWSHLKLKEKKRNARLLNTLCSA
jgi:hypothetical protein